MVKIVFCICILISLTSPRLEIENIQEESVAIQIERAISKGNVDSLSLYIPERIEINHQSQRNIYQKEEAIQFFSNFFKEFPPRNFEYQHKGASEEELQYFIGSYRYSEGNYTLYILLREHQGITTIETIDINVN